jgi:hypothetical protein
MRYSLESNDGDSEIKIKEDIEQVKNLIAFWELWEKRTI